MLFEIYPSLSNCTLVFIMPLLIKPCNVVIKYLSNLPNRPYLEVCSYEAAYLVSL